MICIVRKSAHLCEKVTFTPVETVLLTLLARSPQREPYVRELAADAGVSASGCSKALDRLARMELVSSRRSGRNVHYRINEQNAAVTHFKVFVNVLEVNALVADVREQCSRIILFGSCSRGEDSSTSDIDVLAVTGHVEDVRRRLSGRSAVGRPLRAVILAPSDLMRLKENDPVFHEAASSGIVLWRRAHERVPAVPARGAAGKD
ncbi:MAG: nucleotidyltransferase domain-containing protein [Candidatus Undinarchaeales archaeon]|nr:nucleotidyltransferase domain-containing protein [Candidatus Undinarchaeales archaeon]MDP7492075.1 nucleotidyltransferase domain-containing protein [Candidatus Undinarchaeales archaeon]